VTPEPTLLRIERGNPTPEEIAALVVALAGRRRDGGSWSRPAATGRSPWSAYARSVRPPLLPSPGAWVASARLPR
jgi:hypothetical protein